MSRQQRNQPTMKVYVEREGGEQVLWRKMTREEIMQEFFAPLEEVKRREQTPTWCDLSETRLFELLVRFKPAGVQKWANLAAIHMYMNKIYESEEDGIEIFLNDEDFETVRKRKDLPKAEKTLRFQPRYAIRPDIEQIIAKLDQYWDMKFVEYNEGIPDGLEVHSDFFLPDGQFGELLKELEEKNAAAGAKQVTRNQEEESSAAAPSSSGVSKRRRVVELM
ncbi:CT20 family protein [Ostertagia ostertagi]